MAYRRITTIPLFKNKKLSASGTAISDPIDLRDIANVGNYSISYRVGPAAGATCGTCTFIYLGSPTFDGTYVNETSTSGTTLNSATGGTGLWKFTPFLTPFMKIHASCGTSSSANISAELNVQ